MKDLKSVQVFTPKWATNQMIDLMNPENLSSDETLFFEPSCGDGQMLEVIIERIYLALCQKYNGNKERAFAETLLKFYAADIDPEMVGLARERIFNKAKDVLESDFNSSDFAQHLIAHVLINKIVVRDFFEVMDTLKSTKGHFEAISGSI